MADPSTPPKSFCYNYKLFNIFYMVIRSESILFYRGEKIVQSSHNKYLKLNYPSFLEHCWGQIYKNQQRGNEREIN